MELIVAMFVLGILSIIVINVYIGVTRAMAQGTALNQNTNTAANTMNELSRVIRSGATIPVSSATDGTQLPDKPVFVAATRESVTMYAFVDSSITNTSPVLVSFTVDATTRQLVEKRWPATTAANGIWTFPAMTSPPSKTRTMPGAVVTPTGSSPTYLFTYLDTAGAPISSAGSGVDPSKLGTIASVKLTVVVRADAGSREPAVTLVNTVGLPNLLKDAVTP